MAACGFYGKIPSEGDFVSRRLPWEFTSAWDAWLQQGMQASREALGSRWLELYLSAPIWRFQIAPGLCGPLAWRGVFFASVDRVGRYFPLTLAFCGAPGDRSAAAASASTLSADEAVWFVAEDVALSGLDPAQGIDDFDRAVQALIEPNAGAPAVDEARVLAGVHFFSPGLDGHPAVRLAFAALPEAAAFTTLIAPPAPAPVAAPTPSPTLSDLISNSITIVDATATATAQAQAPDRMDGAP